MPLVAGRYPTKNPEWLLAGEPATAVRQNMRRLDAGSNLAALTSGVVTVVALPLEVGDVITDLTFLSGATAAATPTHQWAALYDIAGDLLAQSDDGTSAAWAANTANSFALATVQEITETGVYYAAISVTAATVPTLVGATLGSAATSTGLLSADKSLARTFGSAVGATAPASIATTTAVPTVPLVRAS